MNNFDLESKLKSVRVPERTEDYWENFPAQVRVQLPRARSVHELRESRLPQFAWSFGLGLACVLVSLLVFNTPLKAASCAFSQKENFVRQQLAALPHRLQTLMADEHGLHYLVAEKE